MVGNKFTWFRPNGLAASRLDRFLMSSDWCCCWPNGNRFVLERNLSDHCPILFRSKVVDWGPKPFKVLNCWFMDPRFKEFVRKQWEQISIPGPGGYVLKEKLKRLKARLRVWNA